ncbi:hypothetical protein NVP1054O_18 [Vibrio phage 1.054.O._10N.261.52.A1]|nr:hypothetical protein NVP1054O_18 [Vibrio phage 1.054.O._10N.261.52.A1]
MTQPLFRYKLHRNSPALEKLINGMSKDGFYFYNQRRYKLVSAVKDGVYINISSEVL